MWYCRRTANIIELHYDDVIKGAMASQITRLMIVYSTVYSQIEVNIKAPRHGPLCGEFTGEFPAQMASYAENVSIWWRYRGIKSIFDKSRRRCRHYLREYILIMNEMPRHSLEWSFIWKALDINYWMRKIPERRCSGVVVEVYLFSVFFNVPIFFILRHLVSNVYWLCLKPFNVVTGSRSFHHHYAYVVF